MATTRIQPNVIKDLHARFSPHPGQIEIGRALFNLFLRLIFIRAGRKFGKALSVDTLIPTPMGFKRLGALRVGDYVFGADGCPTRIIGESDISYDRKMYEISFSDRSKILACEDHLWTVETKAIRKSKRRVCGKLPHITLSTKDMIGSLKYGAEWNYSIDLSLPIQCSTKDFIVDPYVLGAWLGDGTSANSHITIGDEDSKHFMDEISSLGYSIHKTSTINRYLIKKLSVSLRKLDVLNNKHIPEQYFWGDVSQRLALLQGLMDTDGTVGKNNSYCCFDNTNENLSKGVYRLVCSLGGQAKIATKIGKINGVEKKVVHRVYFMPPRNICPFRLKRKADRCRPTKKSNVRFIVDISPIKTKIASKCISVENTDGLYLVGNEMLPTHNTTIIQYCLWRWCNTYPNQGCYYVAPFLTQAKEIVWAPGTLQNFGPSAWIKKIANDELRITFWNGSFIKLCGADNREALRGVNPHFAVYDEYKDFHPDFHKNFGPNLLPNKAPLLVIGTPPDNTTTPEAVNYWKLELDAKTRKKGFFFHAPSWARTNDPEFLEELEEEKRVMIARGDEEEWRREYGAEFVKSGTKVVFPMFDREKHVKPYYSLHQIINLNPSLYEFYTIADPGTRVCFAVLLIAVHKYRKEIIVIDEIYETVPANTATAVICPVIRSKEDEVTTQWVERFRYYDEAATWFFVGTDPHENWMPTRKADMRNEDRDGKPFLSHIKDSLLDDSIVFSDRCVNTIHEIESYQKDKNGHYPKKDDHAIDVLRYFFSLAHITPIEIPFNNHQNVVIGENTSLFEGFDDYYGQNEDEDLINDIARFVG